MNTSQFHGASSRRLLQQLPPGSGGFAARTVPASDAFRVVGDIGNNVETSHVIVHDDEGRVVNYPSVSGDYRPAHFEVVRSYRRDPDIYADAATFRLKFSKPLKSVFVIEVLEINVPNATVPPAHREYLLLNGLFDSNGKYHPQANIPKDLSYHTMITHNANDPGVDRSPASNDAVDLYPYDDYVFGRFKYDSTASFQYWHRHGYHRKTFFPTPIPSLDYLDFSLADPEGTIYDIPAAQEWSATLQIFSKQ